MILVQEGMRNATQTGIGGHKCVVFPFSKKGLRFADKKTFGLLQVKDLSKINKMNLMW